MGCTLAKAPHVNIPSTTVRPMVRRSPGESELTTLGWREWVALPDWSVPYLKAKVDTGARTSTLHAFNLERFERDDQEWIRFEIHPWQRSSGDGVAVEAPVLDNRRVKSSSGDVEFRPVIQATIVTAGVSSKIELTLTRRDEMGFRMLLGRQALRKRFIVNPAASYLGGRPPRVVRRQNRERA